MNGRVHRSAVPPRSDGAEPARSFTRRGRYAAAAVYACALLSLALGATVVVVGTGAPLPPTTLFLALAIPLALCMNRFVFFANEVGVTADAAVLFAAIVAFRGSSPVLGPLMLALLVGLLDAKHWERHAFVRMAYNSGSQALTVLAAVAAFDVLGQWCGGTGAALVVAAILAAVPYVVVESGFGVGLMVLLGEPTHVAVRQHVGVNLLSFPLAAVGAVAGLLAVGVSPWLATALLAPTPFVPEALLVGVRRRRRPEGRTGGPLLASTTGACAAALAVLAALAPMVEGATAIAVGSLAVLLGADARVRRDRPVPPSAVVAIVAAAVLVPGGWAVAVGATAAVLATASAWWASGGGPGATAALALAAAGASFAVAVGVAPATHGSMATLLGASVVGIVFLVLTARPPATIGWSVPLVAAVAGAVLFARSIHGAPGPRALLAAAILVGSASVWGVLPWSSRFLGPWGGRRGRGFAVAVLAAASLAAAAACAWWAVDATDAAAVAVAAGALLVILVAATAVRQWRFAPGRRRRDIAVLSGAGVCVLASGPLALGALTGWPLVAPILAVFVADVVAVDTVRTVWVHSRSGSDASEPGATAGGKTIDQPSA